MKTLVIALTLAASCAWVSATTINPTNKFAYGANLGWLDCRGNTNNGAVVGEYVCSGYLWAANAGWIHLGSNAPANGIRYQNNSATDYGVNHDGQGNLRGYAYGANIGWINFETNGAPRVDLKTGKLSGYAYSANCGWISLSNAFAHVQTDSLPATDSDADSIADAWELTYANSLATFNTSSDTDGDGVLDRNEYLADTNPQSAGDYLRFTSISATNSSIPGYTRVELTWTSRLTRCYALQYRPTLDTNSTWMDSTVFAFPGASNVGLDDILSQDFYRIRAFRPLAP